MATPCQTATKPASSSAASATRRAPLTASPPGRRARGAPAARTRGRRAPPGACAGAEAPPRARATTRPGRGESTATRSASRIASSTSWVTSSTVRGSAASAPASHSCIEERVIESSAPKGSSSSSTGRPGQQRAQEGHALAHPARQRGRPGAARTRRARSARTAARRAGAPPPSPRPGTRAPARRCRARRARGAAGRAGACRRTLARRSARRGAPMTLTVAGVRLLQARHQLEQRGLAAAGRAHHRHQLAGADLQVEPVERDDRGTAAVAALDAAQRDPDVSEVNEAPVQEPRPRPA